MDAGAEFPDYNRGTGPLHSLFIVCRMFVANSETDMNKVIEVLPPSKIQQLFHIDVMNVHIKDYYFELMAKINLYIKESGIENVEDLSTKVFHEKVILNQFLRMMMLSLLRARSKFLTMDILEKKTANQRPKKAPMNKSASEDIPIGLVIKCPKRCLNKLICRVPTRKLVEEKMEYSYIEEVGFTSAEFLNFPKISWRFNFERMDYLRSNPGSSKMFIINQKIPGKPYNTNLPNNMFFKYGILYHAQYQVKEVVDYLELILSRALEANNLIQLVIKEILQDLKAPITQIETSCEYQFHNSQHPYIRNFESVECKRPKKSVDEDEKYDLQLREVLFPSITFNLVDYQRADIPLDWKKKLRLSFTCLICNESFEGFLSFHLAMEHYKGKHMDEMKPDWSCDNCLQRFTTCELAGQRWSHTCHLEPQSETNIDDLLLTIPSNLDKEFKDDHKVNKESM